MKKFQNEDRKYNDNLLKRQKAKRAMVLSIALFV